MAIDQGSGFVGHENERLIVLVPYGLEIANVTFTIGPGTTKVPETSTSLLDAPVLVVREMFVTPWES